MAKKKEITVKKQAQGAKTVKENIDKQIKEPVRKVLSDNYYKETDSNYFKIDGTANHFQLFKINKETNEKTRVLTAGGTTLQDFKRACELYFKNL